MTDFPISKKESPVQSLKAKSSMNFTELPNSTFSSEAKPLNQGPIFSQSIFSSLIGHSAYASVPIEITEEDILKLVKGQPLKALDPIVLTDWGMSSIVKGHSANAELPIDLTDLGKLSIVKGHLANAELPIAETDLPNVKSLRVEQSLKAKSPIVLTESPNATSSRIALSANHESIFSQLMLRDFVWKETKALVLIETSDERISRDDEVQLLKAIAWIVLTQSPTVTLSRAMQSLNHGPISLQFISTLSIEHDIKAPSPMDVTVVGMTKDVNEHPAKEFFPIVFTVEGIVMSLINASFMYGFFA